LKDAWTRNSYTNYAIVETSKIGMVKYNWNADKLSATKEIKDAAKEHNKDTAVANVALMCLGKTYGSDKATEVKQPYLF